MKKQPYEEYINILEERKEYALLCDGKSKKFTRYTEWEEHIKSLISDFRSSEDLYNFKRYCLNAARAQEKAPDMFLSYIGLLIPIYLDALFEGIPALVTLFLFLGIISYIIIQNKKLTKESFFFKDIIEIIEEVEQNKNADKKG